MLDFPNDFCPHKPTERQSEFLKLDCLEAFFGGAAGGGKSVALLMGALQYVDVPGYAALILRKDTQRLALPGGLIPRSHEWFNGKKVRWNEARRTWTFPHETGPSATLTFGYLSKPADKFRYLSSEFQYIAFDELTELTEDDYLYLFSRLRKPKTLSVPLRVRSASNPGGSGHLWVKTRFIDGAGDNRIFLPSLVTDNEHLDADEYRQSLMHLAPVTRERLMNGDWNVQEKNIFREEWIRYFTLADDQYELLDENESLFLCIKQHDCRRFITVDPAGTSAEGEPTASHSFSVIQAWDQPRHPDLSCYLILREQVREQYSLAQLGNRIKGLHKSWKAERIWIEGEKLGHGLITELRKELPEEVVQAVPTGGKSKELRAVPLANKMERGEVFLPRGNNQWRLGFERELLAWTGHKRERCDQIDAAAYAAIIAERQQPAVIVMQHIVERA